MRPRRVDLALVHHPVRNKIGEEISAQIDEFDFFDACRLSLAYPVRRLWIVNPIESQRALAERLITWGRDPSRDDEQRGVFDRTVWVPSLAVALEEAELLGPRPRTVATTAVRCVDALSFEQLRTQIREDERPTMLLFGKGWGLAPSVIEGADMRVEPIDAGTGYNHLSVRAAMAIVVDRLLSTDPVG